MHRSPTQRSSFRQPPQALSQRVPPLLMAADGHRSWRGRSAQLDRVAMLLTQHVADACWVVPNLSHSFACAQTRSSWPPPPPLHGHALLRGLLFLMCSCFLCLFALRPLGSLRPPLRGHSVEPRRTASLLACTTSPPAPNSRPPAAGRRSRVSTRAATSLRLALPPRRGSDHLSPSTGRRLSSHMRWALLVLVVASGGLALAARPSASARAPRTTAAGGSGWAARRQQLRLLPAWRTRGHMNSVRPTSTSP